MQIAFMPESNLYDPYDLEDKAIPCITIIKKREVISYNMITLHSTAGLMSSEKVCTTFSSDELNEKFDKRLSVWCMYICTE